MNNAVFLFVPETQLHGDLNSDKGRGYRLESTNTHSVSQITEPRRNPSLTIRVTLKERK